MASNHTNSIARTVLMNILLALPIAGVSVANQGPDVRGAHELSQTLLDARAARTSADQLPKLLARAGDEPLPLLIDTLVRGRFPVTVGERGNSTQALRPSERNALVAAVGELPWSKVLAFLDGPIATGPSETTRATVLELIGTHGDERDLDSLLRWCGPGADQRVVARPIRRAFATALGNILDREFVTSYKLIQLYQGAHVSLIPTLVTCLGERPGEQNIAALAGSLRFVPEADALLLAELSHLGQRMPHPIDESVLETTRRTLSVGDRSLLVAGIIAAESLEDGGAVPRLIELMQSDDRNVSDHALKALKSITTQQLGRDPVAWQTWHAAARRWRADFAPQLMEDAGDGRAAVASRAILELSKHRFYRHELAGPVARGLRHSEPDVVILTCATLGHLGSLLSVPGLLELLDHDSMEIRRAALLALRRMTKSDHGETAQGWIDAGW